MAFSTWYAAINPIKEESWALVAHTREAEIRMITVPGQPRQKMFMRPHLNRKKSWAW
jgi:hypothetical protein